MAGMDSRSLSDLISMGPKAVEKIEAKKGRHAAIGQSRVYGLPIGVDGNKVATVCVQPCKNPDSRSIIISIVGQKRTHKRFRERQTVPCLTTDTRPCC